MLYRLLLFSVCYSALLSGQTQVFFSPDDKPARHLMRRLGNAQERIYAAVYALSNGDISRTLINAHKRGVEIQVVSDRDYCLHDSYSKMQELRDAGIETFLYPDHAGGIMHHKFAIIDDAVWTGSMNWTRSGNRHNQENSLLITDQDVVHRYLREFEVVKKRCFERKKKKKHKKN